MENNKIPNIRFKGFTDPWEQRKLGDIADIVGGGTPSTSNEEYWDGEIDWYAPAEITNQIYVDSSERRITEQGFNNSSTKMLPVGTVLFTSRAGIGKMAILRKESCTNQGFQSIVPHKNVLDSYFIFSRSEELKRYGETVGAGSTFVEVSGKQMCAMELMMPQTIDEQRKIGSYFSRLDHLITLHQRKYNKLLNVKKSMLEKMFPKNGSNIPEIRFKGFTDPWEQRKVFEIADRFDNLRVPVAANLRIPGNTPYYGANGIQDYVEGYTHDGEYILVAEDGASDLKNYPVNYVNGRIWVNNHAHVLQGKEKIANNKFLSYAMSLADIESVLVGGGRAKLNADIMMNLDIAIPSFNEQEQIGTYFSNLDHLITLHQRELEKLQNIKKSMLEKMFV